MFFQFLHPYKPDSNGMLTRTAVINQNHSFSKGLSAKVTPPDGLILKLHYYESSLHYCINFLNSKTTKN